MDIWRCIDFVMHFISILDMGNSNFGKSIGNTFKQYGGRIKYFARNRNISRMKTQISIIITILFFLSLSSCNSQQKSTTQKPISTSDNSMTSLDWPGTYFGVLPCADCEGIKIQIVLGEDLTFILKNQYIGKSDSVFHETGKFIWNDAGSAITLNNEDHQIYQVGENILFHLDKNGNRITGDLANKYLLEKQKTELTGKYWKLIQLNGKPLEETNREPFIRFSADKGVNGNSSCNSFNGSYELSEGNKIKFSPFAMTRMACIGNNVEQEFMQIIDKTTNYSLSANELILLNEMETALAKFEVNYFK